MRRGSRVAALGPVSARKSAVANLWRKALFLSRWMTDRYCARRYPVACGWLYAIELVDISGRIYALDARSEDSETDVHSAQQQLGKSSNYGILTPSNPKPSFPDYIVSFDSQDYQQCSRMFSVRTDQSNLKISTDPKAGQTRSGLHDTQ